MEKNVLSTSSIIVKSNLPIYAKPVRLGVVGSRDCVDKQLVLEFIILMQFQYDVRYIISGGSRKDKKGVDTLAETIADELQIAKIIYPPQSNKYGYPLCYFNRNEQIAVTSNILLAVWDGYSTGTKDAMTRTVNKNKPVLWGNYKREISLWEPYGKG